MNIKKAIIFLLAAISYTILLKIGVLIFPNIFNSIYLIQIDLVFLVFAGLSLIVFGLYFIKEAIGKNHVKLKTSVYLAMIGPVFFMFKHISDIIRLSDRLSLKLYELSPFLQQFILGYNFKPLYQIVALLSSFFYFYFFYVLYKNLITENQDLKNTNFILLIALGLTLIFEAFSFVIFFIFPNSSLIQDRPKFLIIIGFLIFLFKSLVSISFFWKLYQVKDYSRILKIE